MSGLAPVIAGIELGGTKCICLLGTGPSDVRAEVRIPTRDASSTLAAIAAVIDDWRNGQDVSAIGIASFGPLEIDPTVRDYGHVLATPKPGWSHADLLAPLRRCGVPIAVDTDVNGAALAEGRWGAAQGLRSYVYITVGTGIGVGSIVAGQPVRGLGHSEAGHLRVPRLAGDRWPGACPFHGDCVEGLASGPAIAARVRRPAEALSADDPVWASVVHALAGLLHNLTLTVVPERILIGGGLANGRPHLLPRIRRALDDSLAGYGVASRAWVGSDGYVLAPALGDRAGPLGAIAVALAAADQIITGDS
jgi:fructokinase